MPVARVAASVMAAPLRKLSEPVLHQQQSRPEDLDVLACELSQMGLSTGNCGGVSPPPPAPPPRDASIASVTDGDDQTSATASPEFGLGESSSDTEDDVHELRASVNSSLRGSGPLALPDLLPKPRELNKMDNQRIGDDSVEELPGNASACANGSKISLHQQPLSSRDREKSFVGFFGTGTLGTGTVNRPGRTQDASQVQVNVNPSSQNGSHLESDAPEIRKYKKKFSGEILCAALWGVNLLIGTDGGLMLLDRSGQGKVYQLISRRRFEQMTVLEGQNILITISGRKRRIRVYYLSWLKQKILRTESFGSLSHLPLIVDLTVEENARLKVLYGSHEGFHAIDLDSAAIYDIYTPPNPQQNMIPHCIVVLPNSNGMQLLLCYDNEGVYVNTYGKMSKNVVLQWGEMPSSVAYISTGQIMGWGNKAIEIRSVDTGHLDGVFMHKKAQKLKFLCERNDKVFFSSAKGGGSCQIYFMTLNKPGLSNW
ncbi:CNH domain protein [Teladorsagia circumcincta]|uniref:non-specific serine/threonine protein kinase n=1 Tax=Teladorsagia circumcincta TaxID=45464 RepID=A0A2G9V0A3_TELCI|nr:CNH domain protein [Teladorsagia circumcincta]